MKVLVTGGTSLMGAGVVRALRSRGDEVTAFQRRPSGSDGAEHLGDVTDVTAVRAAVDGQDAVIHLAARVGIVGDWAAFEATNVHGTANVLDAAHTGGVQRFVHISSPSVAHQGSALVGVGAAPANPEGARGHYARSKALAERLALDAGGQHMSVVSLRPHLVWGPGDTQLIGRIVDRAIAGRLALVGTGAALIDTTYLDNAVDAIVAALDRAGGLNGRALVVSNGQPRTVSELVTRICQAAGVAGPTVSVPYALAKAGGAVVERVWGRLDRRDDPPMTSFLAEQLATAHWFDQRTTRAALDWRPVIDLDEGFERLAAWYTSERRPGEVAP